MCHLSNVQGKHLVQCMHNLENYVTIGVSTVRVNPDRTSPIGRDKFLDHHRTGPEPVLTFPIPNGFRVGPGPAYRNPTRDPTRTSLFLYY